MHVKYHIVQILFGCLGCLYLMYWLGFKQAQTVQVNLAFF